MVEVAPAALATSPVQESAHARAAQVRVAVMVAEVAVQATLLAATAVAMPTAKALEVGAVVPVVPDHRQLAGARAMVVEC